MTSKTDWDAIYIGASLLTLLDAAARIRKGQNVLMIDDQDGPGGAWRSLSLFGLTAIENAIHYFLPDDRGIRFMKEELALNVEPSTGKYSVFTKGCFGIRRIPYDSAFAGPLEQAYQANGRNSAIGTALRLVADSIRAMLRGKRRRSFYLRGGTPEVMACIQRLLNRIPVPMQLGQLVTDVAVEPDRGLVTLTTSTGQQYSGRQAVLTQSLKLPAIRTGTTLLPIPKEELPRPQVHLLVEDPLEALIREAIFVADSEIKYIHDITRYVPERAILEKQKRRVFALAVHPHISYEPGLAGRMLSRMLAAGLASSQARLLDEHYFVADLPGISEETLKDIQGRSSGHIDYLITDSFANCLGRYAERWSGVLH